MSGDVPTEDMTADVNAHTAGEASGRNAMEEDNDGVRSDKALGGEEAQEIEGEKDAEKKANKETEALNVDAVLADLEGKHASLQEEHDACLEKLEVQSKQLKEAQEKATALNEEKLRLEKELAEAKRQGQSGSDEIKCLEQERKVFKERMDRTESEADSLREEISRLARANKELQSSLTEMEVRSKLSNSELAPLFHENQRLQTEVDSISAHCKWLEGELEVKLNEYTNLKKSQSSEVGALRNDLDQANREKEAATARVKSMEQSEDKLLRKVEMLSQQLLQAKQENLESSLTAEQSLAAERRLVELQKEQLDRLEKRHDDVAREMEAMQVTANEALEESKRERQQRVDRQSEMMKRALEEQSKQYESQLEDLTRQLTEANRRRVEVEDRFLGLPTNSHVAPLAIMDGGLSEDGPISLTDLTTRLTQTQNELITERNRRKKIEIHFERIQKEIEAKAPLLIRQRQEYEFAMKRQDEYEKRLSDAFQEITMYRSEVRDLRVELSRAQKRNHLLEQESAELAKQVQGLLLSRSGIEVQNGEVPTSIEEIQSQNQRLLGEHRRLTGLVKDLEEKLATDSLRQTLEASEKQLASLREDRKRQESFVAGIVQQRDLYRALLSKHDSKLMGTEDEEATAIEIMKRQSERTNRIESKNEELQAELAIAKGELDRATRNEVALSERLCRNEELVLNFTKEVDSLRLELSTAKADAARVKAECDYLSDRASRMEHSLDAAREETAQITNAKNELQRINIDLQNAVTAASAESAKFDSERRQLEQKLRFAESQVATMKAAEKRTVDENNQLRSELARQGGLVDTVRRIEASLAAKVDQDTANLKEECEKLSVKLEKEESKHATELESLLSKIHELEARGREAESSCQQAKKESLEAKKTVLAKQEEIQRLTAKYATLASQLHALRKKYGETDDSTDIDASLQERIKAFTSELEATKAELATQKEAAENYQRVAKTSESSLADLTKTTQEFRKTQEKEIEKLNATISELKKENKARQNMVSELTNDLMKVRGEHDQVVRELKNQIESLKQEMQNVEKDASLAKAQVGGLKLDLESVQERETKAQNDYERELSQHAAARTELRHARSEAEEERRNRLAAEDLLSSVKKEFEGLRAEHDREKASLQEALESTEKRLKGAEEQNDLLHHQLQDLGALAEKSVASRIAAAIGDAATSEAESSDNAEIKALNKTVSELRQIVTILRTEKEMMQAQVDAAKRTAEREKAAGAVTRRSLDEARAELQMLTSSSSSKFAEPDGKDLTIKLLAAEDQLTLLRDSNQLLRDEAHKLKKSLELLQSDMEAAAKATIPAEKRKRELETANVALEAEKASLNRELEAWKGRVQSLVSKFNQVDPEEHKQALAKVQDLQKEVDQFKCDKESAQSESVRMRNIATRLTQELAQQKKLVEAQTTKLAQLAAQQQVAASSKKAEAAAERDQLKEKIGKIEKELNSAKTELEGANDRNNKLRERLRQFQKIIQDLRVKEKDFETQLAEARARSSQQQSTVDGFGEGTTHSPPEQEAARLVQVPKPKLAEETEGKHETPTEASTPSKELLLPPPGGFNFGPSESSTKAQSIESTVIVEAKSQSQSAVLTTSQASTTSQPSVSATIASVAQKPDDEGRKPSSTTAQNSGDSGLPASAAPVSPKTTQAQLSPRRNSGNKAELSMKERLLEKKRRLAQRMAKEIELQRQTVEVRQPGESAGPTQKRPKLESEKGSLAVSDDAAGTNASPTPAEAPSQKDQAMTLESKDPEYEEGEMVEALVDEESKNEAALSSHMSASTVSVFAGDIRPSGLGAVNPFGGAPAPSGNVSASFFGTAATSISESTALGSKLASNATSGGGAFLDFKPPGTQAPTFQFGSSKNITLPTPTTFQTSTESPFGVFSGDGIDSAKNPFGAFGGGSIGRSGATTLFGSSAPIEEINKQEEGEVANAEPTDG